MAEKIANLQKDGLDTYKIGVEELIGTFDGKPLYRKVYHGTGSWTGYITLDESLNATLITPRSISEVYKVSTGSYTARTDYYSNNARGYCLAGVGSASVVIQNNTSITEYNVILTYTKNS